MDYEEEVQEAVQDLRDLIAENEDVGEIIGAGMDCQMCGVHLEIPLDEMDELAARLMGHIMTCPVGYNEL